MSASKKVFVFGIMCMSVLGSGCSFSWPWARPQAQDQLVAVQPVPEQTTTQPQEAYDRSKGFGTSILYQAPTIKIDSSIAKDFDISAVKNIQEMASAYGVKFADADIKFLSKNKFVVKNLLDTKIRPNSVGDNVREFTQLYDQVKGPRDPHDRGPQNALFFSSDVFFNAYNNLYTELLKEMENKTFYPNARSISMTFFEEAGKKMDAAQTDSEKQKWMKVRNYFAVPYAIFSTAAQPLSVQDYYSKEGAASDPSTVQSDYQKRDATVDTYDKVASFIKTMKLDGPSEIVVLADLKHVYDAKDKGVPSIFSKEYAEYAKQEDISFSVDFTQFTPRGSYTSSSLRRQYFRGTKWFIMLPLFLKSADLTSYSFAIAQLLAENPRQMKDYTQLEDAINFLVGTSDDLMPVDYLLALQAAKDAPDQTAASMEYLVKARQPLIKDLPAAYPCTGCVSSEDVLLKTKGMRFFSGKFIIDSYWTGQLTQGDEALKPGYTQKLPPMASSLEVMTILGSDYAKTQIPKLDFYTPKYSQAIDKAVTDLKTETDRLTEADWTKNIYTGWLWTIKGLFSWLKTNHDNLPRFMQSVAWEAKTLQTATAFWTELRHATILYAKQSFAELGGGPGNCDPRQIPQPPKAYIEPQLEAFARLSYLAKRTGQGLKDQGYQLDNLYSLENFVGLLEKVQVYVVKELENSMLSETINKETMPDLNDPTKTCAYYAVQDGSDWETLRLAIVDGLKSSLPRPVEGPILPAKDRRAALVADVHTGGDSDNPYKILYEAEGVPYVIFTAVKDINGPRLTVGFISSQYEFTKPYGGPRMTDEDWQKSFFIGSDPYDAYKYTDKRSWPAPNAWYAPMFGEK